MLDRIRQPHIPRSFQRRRAAEGIAVVGQVVGREFGDTLRRLYNEVEDERLDVTLRRALEAGWTARALATALRCTGERVLQRAAGANLLAQAADVPPAPRKPPPAPRRPRQQAPVVPVEFAAELRRLHGIGVRVVRGTPADSPYRKASADLGALIARLIQDGYAVTSIARAMDVAPDTVRGRLAKHREGERERR